MPKHMQHIQNKIYIYLASYKLCYEKDVIGTSEQDPDQLAYPKNLVKAYGIGILKLFDTVEQADKNKKKLTKLLRCIGCSDTLLFICG